jgi:hypothetical protein
VNVPLWAHLCFLFDWKGAKNRLRLNLATDRESLESVDRMIDLADSLFCLQECEGFHLKIKDLKEVAPTEVKCKREDMSMDANSLRRTLYIAEKQLPTNAPGVIFARLPTARGRDASFSSQVTKVFRNFFQNVHHISAVVLVWEEWIKLSGDHNSRLLRYRSNLHPSPKYPVDGLDEILLPADSIPDDRGLFLSLSFGVFG